MWYSILRRSLFAEVPLYFNLSHFMYSRCLGAWPTDDASVGLRYHAIFGPDLVPSADYINLCYHKYIRTPLYSVFTSGPSSDTADRRPTTTIGGSR